MKRLRLLAPYYVVGGAIEIEASVRRETRKSRGLIEIQRLLSINANTNREKMEGQY